jgi:hypothetical protein
MFTETILKIPFSVIGRCTLVPTSHWLQENAQKLTCGFRYDFTESQAASCKHFQCKNHRFRFFEAGFWKEFEN